MGSVGQSLDVQGIVQQLLTTMRRQQAGPYESQRSTLQAQNSAYGDLQGRLTTLYNQVIALQQSPGPLQSQTVSTSDSTKVTATANGAINGSYAIDVTTLAKAANYTTTNSFATADTQIGIALSETITVTQNGSSASISVLPTDTMNTLKTKFNNAGLNLSASVIQDGTSYRLSVTSTQSGSAQDITITGDTQSVFTKTQTGINASFKVNGQTLASASNVVTGALPGATLTLIATTGTPSTAVNLTIGTDTAGITTALQNFANAFNDLNSYVNTQTKFVSGAPAPPLGGNSLPRTIMSTLTSLFNTSFSGNSTYKTLSSLGIELQQDGSIKINSATLTTAVNSNLTEVQRIFQQITVPNGIGKQMSDALYSYYRAGDGVLTVAVAQNQQVIQGITDQIAIIDQRLRDRAVALTAQYSQADNALRSLNRLQGVLAGLG